MTVGGHRFTTISDQNQRPHQKTQGSLTVGNEDQGVHPLPNHKRIRAERFFSANLDLSAVYQTLANIGRGITQQSAIKSPLCKVAYRNAKHRGTC